MIFILSLIYNLLYIFVVIFATLFSVVNKKQRTFIFSRLFQNFDFLEKKDTIWIHTSSVGEINLSEPLVREFLKDRTENILISVFTDTGFETAKNKYKDEPRIKIILFPLDSFWDISHILTKINLKLLVIVETEIWCNLIFLSSLYSKIVFVNGRISERSFKRYQKIKFILKILFNKISGFYMQSNIDGERIKLLGADKNKIEVFKNLKFSIELENYSDKEKEALKKQINSNNRKIIVLGSTRELEEELILKNIKHDKNNLIIIVPRHLKRVEEVIKVIQNNNLTYQLFSNLEKDNSENNFVSDILIVDKMGVLRKFYSICDVAFVGGTLVNIGGHSLLEPIYYGHTPIFGKYLQNVKEISEELLKRNLGYKIESPENFQETLNKILSQKNKSKETKIFLDENRNSIKKLIKTLEKML